MSKPNEGVPIQIRMRGGNATFMFIYSPELCRRFSSESPSPACARCALYSDPACSKHDCDDGLYLTEERYALAKLLGPENLEPV